jgi:hypothetical protein
MSAPAPHGQRTLDDRVVKLLLPLPLIRAMDRLLVAGVGGFTTRNEFVREAIDSYILELTHEEAPEEPNARSDRRLAVAPKERSSNAADLLEFRPAASQLAGRLLLEATMLLPPPATLTVGSGEAEVIAEPLFGMHNRDYPSLWVARRLADYLAAGPLSFDEFTERATEEAWAFAEALRPLEHELGQKLTALFPTNPEKQQTASSAFRTFAIGSLLVRDDAIRAEGPLFLWRLIDVTRAGGGTVVRLTRLGKELLERLTGLTVAPPHSPEQARIFLAHLRKHAPADWWGFERVVALVAERPTRAALIDGFRAAHPAWGESVAATNAQGYVARAREWGLIAPKVIDGRYELTQLGAELAEGVDR